MLVRYTQDAAGKQTQKALVYTEAEHCITPKKVDSEAIRIITGLHKAGHEAYIVGGAVRDLLIGKTPKDFDIATSAEPARIRKIFKNSRKRRTARQHVGASRKLRSGARTFCRHQIGRRSFSRIEKEA